MQRFLQSWTVSVTQTLVSLSIALNVSGTLQFIQGLSCASLQCCPLGMTSFGDYTRKVCYLQLLAASTVVELRSVLACRGSASFLWHLLVWQRGARSPHSGSVPHMQSPSRCQWSHAAGGAGLRGTRSLHRCAAVGAGTQPPLRLIWLAEHLLLLAMHKAERTACASEPR